MSNELSKSQAGGALAISAQEMDEMFGNSALDTQGLSFPSIKISRETAQFMLGEAEVVKSLTGHVLHLHFANQWWEKGFDERTESDSPMPNCYSVDGIQPCGGDKRQSEFCATCPLNKFGTGKDGSGKACRNTIRILFLQDGAVLPVFLSVPPTSLGKKESLSVWRNSIPNKVAEAYNTMGIKNNKGGSVVDYWPAQVKLSLQKKKFNSGMEASVLQVETLGVLIPDTPENGNEIRSLFLMVKEAKKAYQEQIQAYMSSDHEEVVAAPDGAGEVPEAVPADDDEIPL